LVLRAQTTSMPLAFVPLVMVVMNVVYASAAYPFGKWSDRMAARDLLAASLVVLVAADLVLAAADGPAALAGGVVLWGLHMGMSQGLLARMVADVAPAELRGTAFGAFDFASGLALLVASGLAGFLRRRTARQRRSSPAQACGRDLAATQAILTVTLPSDPMSDTSSGTPIDSP
jgi:MFS family permease